MVCGVCPPSLAAARERFYSIPCKTTKATEVEDAVHRIRAEFRHEDLYLSFVVCYIYAWSEALGAVHASTPGDGAESSSRAMRKLDEPAQRLCTALGVDRLLDDRRHAVHLAVAERARVVALLKPSDEVTSAAVGKRARTVETS